MAVYPVEPVLMHMEFPDRVMIHETVLESDQKRSMYMFHVEQWVQIDVQIKPLIRSRARPRGAMIPEQLHPAWAC